MVIQLSLSAGAPQNTHPQVEVQTAMEIDTADPRWAGWLVETIIHQAQEGARRLVAELTPPLQGTETPFVPLADIAPRLR